MKAMISRMCAGTAAVLLTISAVILAPAASASEEAANQAQLVYAPHGEAEDAVAGGTDLERLRVRLRASDGLGLGEKLTLKHGIESLVNDFVRFHLGEARADLVALRQRFDGLMGDVLTPLRDGDPPLHRTILASRDTLWRTLSDPISFARQFSALMRSASRGGSER